MIKKITIFLIVVILTAMAISIVTSIYKNNPQQILKKIEKNIQAKDSNENYNDWLWQNGRTFIFDVIYANIFSPGIAKMKILRQADVKNTPVYILEAMVEPNVFFKKMYDAKMVLSSAVIKDTKLPLWYNEESFTPEEKKSKQIIFDLDNNIAEREGIKFKIPKETYDPLSVFFNFLDREFKIGKTITLKLLSKEDIYDFKVKPVELKNNIYKLNGEVFRENRSSTAHGAHFNIWVFDNGRVRVPLLVRVNSAGGVIYLRLRNIE